MNAERLRHLQNRGQFFYQNFPGAAAAEEWKRVREEAEGRDADAAARDGHPDGERDPA
jgi:hypothetical protein